MNTKIDGYKNFGKCLWADNGTVKVIIPLSLGIRIINFSFIDGENMFFEQPDNAEYLTFETGWRIFGGSRLWRSPETRDCYYPDAEPIEYSVEGNTIVLTQPTDPYTQLQKIFTIVLNESGSEITVNYKISNCSDHTQEISLWAITAMDGGGIQTVPLKTQDSDPFNPLHTLKLWEYTDLSDERVSFTNDKFIIKHKPLEQFFKIGFNNQFGVVNYSNKGYLFTKKFPVYDNANYPDGGINYETYMCKYMNELETLSPIYTVESGASAEYYETWSLSAE